MSDLATWFWLGFFFGYVPLAVIAGVYASGRGRIGGGYFLLALLVSPVIVILLVALLDPRAGANTKSCPHCAEIVKRAAAVCKHCGRDVPELSAERQLHSRYGR